MVSIPACHAGDRGSIPRRGGYIFCWFLCILLVFLANIVSAILTPSTTYIDLFENVLIELRFREICNKHCENKSEQHFKFCFTVSFQNYNDKEEILRRSKLIRGTEGGAGHGVAALGSQLEPQMYITEESSRRIRASRQGSNLSSLITNLKARSFYN